MEIWLKGSSNFRFPVLPSSYEVTSERDNNTITVNSLGEVDLGGKRKLKSVSFSSFFPYRNESYADGPHKAPKKCVQIIQNMQNSDSKPKLIITGTPVRFSVTIESFTYREDDGTGDISFDITLKEHRAVSVTSSAVVTLSSSSSSTTVAENGVERSQPEQTATTYTVKSGDCLSAIARTLTGSSDWQTIYNANKDTIGSNPNLIYPGQVLTIPS